MLSKLLSHDMNKHRTREHYIVPDEDKPKRPKKKQKVSFEEPQLEVRNYYELLPKQYQPPPLHYINEPEIQIDLPSNFVICGRTGGGKTNFLKHLITEIAAWPRIIFCIRERNEPFYQHFIDETNKLADMYDNNFIQIYERLKEVPPVQVLLDMNTPTLIDFDDQICENDEVQREHMGNYFIVTRFPLPPLEKLPPVASRTFFIVQTWRATTSGNSPFLLGRLRCCSCCV